MPAYLFICALGSLFDALIHIYRHPAIYVGRNAPRLPTKGPGMFRSQQYRAKAAKYGKLVKSSAGSEEGRRFRKLQERLALRADNEQALADSFDNAVQVAEKDRSHGAALAAEEEHVLRCLGAAIIMQWNSLPTTLQREIFDTAGSVGKLLETAALRGQIARFLHKHKNDAGCNRLPDAARRDATLGTAALSRWDNEGGAVHEGPAKTVSRLEQESLDVAYANQSR